jgi:hypothetical protein
MMAQYVQVIWLKRNLVALGVGHFQMVSSAKKKSYLRDLGLQSKHEI